MISFENDYNTGAHEQILKKLAETNLEPTTGYGNDHYTKSAVSKIKTACGCPDAEVYFLVGGTQMNETIISLMLKDYQGVVSCSSGHVNVHEAGAIEYSGKKVISLPAENGLLNPLTLKNYLINFFKDPSYDHMVIPGMVYISHPSEYGTLYTKKDLERIADICHEYDLVLYLDGARLAYGLESRHTDVTLKDIARICDVFYIGGTKCGALFGEAVVFTKNNAPKYFVTSIKKRGALLAKGRLLGIQFDTLFTDDLYFKIGKHAIDLSEELKQILKEKGYEFYIDSPTNQQFVIIDDEKCEKLKEKVGFSIFEKYGDKKSIARFVTSWSTKEEDVEYLKSVL